MKLIIDIDEDYYEIVKHIVEHGQDYTPFKIIANGTPIPDDATNMELLNDINEIIKRWHDMKGDNE